MKTQYSYGSEFSTSSRGRRGPICLCQIGVFLSVPFCVILNLSVVSKWGGNQDQFLPLCAHLVVNLPKWKKTKSVNVVSLATVGWASKNNAMEKQTRNLTMFFPCSFTTHKPLFCQSCCCWAHRLIYPNKFGCLCRQTGSWRGVSFCSFIRSISQSLAAFDSHVAYSFCIFILLGLEDSCVC